MTISLRKFPQILCIAGSLMAYCGTPSIADEVFKSSVEFLHPDAILPVDEAFKLQLLSSETGLSLVWEIAEGYYLYKDRISIASKHKILPLSLPRGEPKNDPHFGSVEVYYDRLNIALDLPADGNLDTLTVSYQGCAEVGVCYPLHTQEIEI